MAATQKELQDLQGFGQQSPPQQWDKDRIPVLDGGMRVDKSRSILAENESPLIQNLTLINNRMVVDGGYILLGTFLSGTAIGTVCLFYQFFNPNGTSTNILVTTSTVYQLVTSLNQWQLLGTGVTATTNAVANSGATSISVASVPAGMATGAYIGIPLDDGEQLVATVTGVVSTTVSFTPAIPSPRNCPNSSVILLGYPLHGNVQDQVVPTSFPGKEWVIFTNQIDPIFYFDGTANTMHNLVTASDLPANTTCAGLVVFHESLLLLATEENGTELPQRVRMSDIGNPLSWTPAALGGPSTSIAAIYDLLDTEDFILYGALLGPYLILYRETTVMRGTYLGILGQIIFWEYTVFGEGAVSVASIAELGSTHEFVGNGSVYQYDGSYSLEGVGDPVFQSFLSAVGDLNPLYRGNMFVQYNQDYDEFWIFYTSGQVATLPNKMLRNSLEKNGWYIRFFANQVVSAAPYLPVDTVIWSTAIGTWASQTANWNSRFFQANVANLVFCASDTNQCYLYDYSATSDAGTAIQWLMQTKDIGKGSVMTRWDRIRLYGIGNNITVAFSIDDGNIYTVLGTVSFGSTASLQTLTFNVVSEYISFQLTGSDPTFEFKWLEVWSQEESEY